MTSLPAWANGAATGKMKCGALPVMSGYGFVPKSRIDRTRGSPLYQRPSCEVSP